MRISLRPFLLTLAFVLLVGIEARACPFCTMQGQTLTKEINDANFVILGTISKALPSPDGLDGTCEVVIDEVIKSHPFLKDKKQITLPRYIPVTKVKFLLFCTVYKDRPDPYRGIPVKETDIVTYLKGALNLDDKNIPKRLEFFFPYLENPEIEVSTDAYKEFAAADAKDVMTMIGSSDAKLVRAKLVEWLRSPETASYRYGLYGYLLGQAGKPEDAQVLVELLNDPKRGLVSGVDGVLAGYITLQPKEGWEYLLALLSNNKADFTRRYAGLRTVRFFWEYRQDVVKPKELVSALTILLDQPDIADLAVEDLRKWKQWTLLDRILELATRSSHDVPIVQRAILRYALTCPDTKAAAFVQEQRKVDADRVKDVEELLRLDMPVKVGG
jgi:hypothetical protein